MKMSKKQDNIDHLCDSCGKDFEELHEVESYRPIELLKWLCEGCFEKEHGCKFEEYY